MDDMTKTVKALYDEMVANDRRSVVVRSVEEHSAQAYSGTAGLMLPLDGMLIGVAEMKFKLVFNEGFAGDIPQGVPTGTSVGYGYQAFQTLTSWMTTFPLGSAVLADNAWGAQCWDYAAAFWKQQVGRTLSTANTGNVRAAWENARAYNLGSEFEAITSWSNIKRGDWLFFGGSVTGHVAMAIESPTGNSVKVWNQNWSGQAYPLGGKVLSEDTITNANFLGAMRYKVVSNWSET